MFSGAPNTCGTIGAVRALAENLQLHRFTAMSTKMAVIVEYTLDEPPSEPAISNLVVTSDGFAARIGRYSDRRRG